MTNTTIINNTEILGNESFEENLTPETKSEEKLSVLETILAIRYFLPLLTLVSVLIGMIFGGSTFVSVICLILSAIGILSALTVCPLKLISFPIKCGFNGFRLLRGFIPFFGLADFVAGIIGLSFGLFFGLIVVLYFPAFFTIKKLLSDDED